MSDFALSRWTRSGPMSCLLVATTRSRSDAQRKETVVGVAAVKGGYGASTTRKNEFRVEVLTVPSEFRGESTDGDETRTWLNCLLSPVLQVAA